MNHKYLDAESERVGMIQNRRQDLVNWFHINVVVVLDNHVNSTQRVF